MPTTRGTQAISERPASIRTSGTNGTPGTAIMPARAVTQATAVAPATSKIFNYVRLWIEKYWKNQIRG